MSWDSSLRLTLFVALLSLWWLRSRFAGRIRKILHVFVTAIITAILYDAVGRKLMLHLVFSAHAAVLNASHNDRFQMALTLGAVTWLLYRSWQTLMKPVTELVDILNIDIPQAPEVCLAGIRADSATLAWARPNSHRLAPKYLIQVNGVQVGEATGNEAGITITGLRPNHFYNIRVVAVGHNNFRSGSPVIRFRTFGKDGRPRLGNSRLPTNFVQSDHSLADADDDDESDTPGTALPAVEATPVLDGVTSASRETPNATSGQRRNTLNRRQSPAVPTVDQTQARTPVSTEPELPLPELNERFENVRREIEATIQLLTKEQNEASQQEGDLRRERERKRQALREKEEQTARLRTAMRTTMEQMRVADKERQKKEQQLREREIKKIKIQEGISKVEEDLERMKRDREGFEARKTDMEKERDRKLADLDSGNADLQEQCAALEAELKEKGKQLQKLKASREQLPGAIDEKWEQDNSKLRREWDLARKDLQDRLVAEVRHGSFLESQIRSLEQQLAVRQQQAGINFYQQPPSAGIEYDPNTVPQTGSKRSSYLGNGGGLGGTPMSSPPMNNAEPTLPGQTGFSQVGFSPSLFLDMPSNADGTGHSEAELKATGGPLSPSAQTLLPSNIFDDGEELDNEKIFKNQALSGPLTADGDDPRSPVSPTPSFQVFSSPHGSSQNLPFPQYVDANERLPLNMSPSPVAAPSNGLRLSSLLSNFHRRVPKDSEDAGPPIGSLKSSQSQSFPRGAEELESQESKWKYLPWMNKTSPTRKNELGQHCSETRRVNSLKSTRISAISDEDLGHARTPSIHSMDRARPSTDSASIWGAPPSDVSGIINRFWLPKDNLWPSRSGSRRPSLHGSTTALTTTLASADDEILDEQDLRNPQTLASQVGIIGSRLPGTAAQASLPGSKAFGQHLNPTAPTFMNIFQKDKDKTKDRNKDKTKEDKGKGKEASTPNNELAHTLDDSPCDSRVSKDTYSVHTGTSVSESRESLQLEATGSNTPSDMNSVSTSNVKESENVVRKLFRKGSSGKFSLSSRLGKESGLFKKGSGSASNSDRLASAEQRSSIGDADELGEDIVSFGRSYDSVASSPSLGPSKSRDTREGRMSSWRFSMRKKSKDTGIREQDGPDMDGTVAPD